VTAETETGPAPSGELPLAGFRILAVEQYGAGPFATMLLADLGAEVIKIEDRESGDVGRYVPPYLGDQDSLYFQALNRNKKSLALDLRSPEDYEVFRRLAAVSDAVFNNLRGDQPGKRGLTYADLGEVNPRLVCVHLTGFGRDGERSAEPGYDYLMQGYAGWMSITGEPGSPPTKSGLSMVDLSAGVMASLGLVSALHGARRTGLGTDVDTSLFGTAISMLTYVGTWHLTRGYQPARLADSSHPSQVPSQVLPTADGWLVVMCAKEKFFKRLVQAMGRPDLAMDPLFVDFEARLANRELLVKVLKELSVRRTTQEWLDVLRHQVPCAPVRTVEEALQDPQVEADGLVIQVAHETFGTVSQLASPIRVAGASREHQRAPRLGEHNGELASLLEGRTGEPARIADRPDNTTNRD
jgi:crotonobetainyl-CoA:carnitine CoA-transferase CaiB-like acyl-CoA transferase